MKQRLGESSITCWIRGKFVAGIAKLPRGKPKVVHFNCLAPFAGSNEEHAEARVRHVSPPDSEFSFKEFMLLHSNGQKSRYGVTREEPQLVQDSSWYMSCPLCSSGPPNVPRHCTYLQEGVWIVGEATQTKPRAWKNPSNHGGQQEKERSVFYLVTKQLSHHKPTYRNVWDTLVELNEVLLTQNISSLAIRKIASRLDGLDWRERTDKRKAWILKLRIGKPVSKFMRVCSLHFAEEDYFYRYRLVLLSVWDNCKSQNYSRSSHSCRSRTSTDKKSIQPDAAVPHSSTKEPPSPKPAASRTDEKRLEKKPEVKTESGSPEEKPPSVNGHNNNNVPNDVPVLTSPGSDYWLARNPVADQLKHEKVDVMIAT
ncbi:hypothetical protein NQ318_011679 [Aromia moschata]|uniref:THAP-type domain-containing protein n=1 Tax=Aromia moschata TaxID=1265417 RepID=A0AAV8X3A8_9CUCU|nr:hypothetical protein NQ318_011679 [Aromia moschata]